jgi:hypothetical protein
MHGLVASWSWRTVLILAAAGLLVSAPLPARADLIVSVQSVTATAGTNGNSLEVDLQNTGAAVDIAGFTFELTVTSSSGVTFTGADESTRLATYIFAGNSVFGPNINTTTGTTLDASDVAADGSTPLGTGSAVGLGEVFFNVAGSAPGGAVTVTLTEFPATSLAGPNANNIPIDTLNNGTITIMSSAVPEPSSLVSAILGLLCSLLYFGARWRTVS